MSTGSSSRRRDGGPGGGRVAHLAVAAALATLACSPVARHRVLSAVFDGVPPPPGLAADPTAPTEPGAGRSRRPPPVVPASVHPPFAERRCAACHTVGEVPNEVPQRYCLACHDRLGEGIAWLHGPVAFGDCLRCHVPHDSMEPRLLRRAGDALCTFCHEHLADPHPGPERGACLACHHAHGGDTRLMLRAPRAAGGS